MDTNCCLKCMRELEDGRCLSCGDIVMKQDSRHLKPGTILKGKYLIGYSIGAGGFGITYIGRDLVLGMRIAVKEYYPSQFSVRNSTVSADVTATAAAAPTGDWNSYERSKERFLNEVRTLARFEKDTGIVNVKDFFEANNTAYIVMEYIDGLTLKEYLEQHGNFDAADIVARMRPVMESLVRVHDQGLLHRDISPDNIKMPTEGNLKLLDFGAARFVSADTYRTVTNMTKPGYAPEEQYRSGGELGPWSDIYALCATIYKCITGITPSDAPQRLHNKSRNKRDIAAPSELSIPIKPALEFAILKGMSVLQEERYQNISELLAAIDDSAKTRPSQTLDRSLQHPVSLTPSWSKRSSESANSTGGSPEPPYILPKRLFGSAGSTTGPNEPPAVFPKRLFGSPDSTVGSTEPSSVLSFESEGSTIGSNSPFALSQNSVELTVAAADESPFALPQNSVELTVAADESPFALSQNLAELTVAADESPFVLPQRSIKVSEQTPNIASPEHPYTSPQKSFDSPQASLNAPPPSLSSPQPSLNSPPPSLSPPQPSKNSIPLFDDSASKRKGKSNQSHGSSQSSMSSSSSQPPLSPPQPLTKSTNSLPLFNGAASTQKRISKKVIVISCAAVGVVLIVAALYVIGYILSSPDKVAKEYYKAIADEDYAKAFTYISIDSSEFINEASFKKYMQGQKEQVSFAKDFTVKSEDNGSAKNVSILNSGSEKITSFVLKKNNKKKFLIFADYDVNIDDALVVDYKLSVPKGFTVTLNGIDLKDPDISEADMDTYTIARIFPDKQYELRITGDPSFEDYISDTFEIQADDSAKTISKSNMTLKQSARDEIGNKAEEDYKKIFLGVIEKKRFEQMDVSCTSNETQKADIIEKITAFASKIMPASGAAYKSVTFKSFSDISVEMIGDNDNMTYQCTMSVLYDCVKVGRIVNPNPYLRDTVEETKHSDQRQTIKFVYAYENDAWVLCEIESLGASY